MVNVQGAMRNNQQIAVALDDFTGATPEEKFMNAYNAGRGSNPFATQWEMGQLGSFVQRGYLDWSNVTFYEGGNVVDVPKPAVW